MSAPVKGESRKAAAVQQTASPAPAPRQPSARSPVSPLHDILSLSRAAPSNGGPRQIRAILNLQRTIGNRVTGRLLQRLTEPAQPQPTVGEAGGAFEREADVATTRVMAGAGAPTLSRLSARNMLSPAPEEGGTITEEAAESGSPVQGRSGPQAALAPPLGLAERLTARRSQGQPLPDAERGFFENRFGQGFGRVRVHADGEAQRIAESVSARAFTYGSDVYFNRGQYRPDARAGRAMLAHELAHVIQQGGGTNAGIVQRQCITGAPCNPPISGDPGVFGCDEGGSEAPGRAAARQSPVRANDLEALAAANGLPLSSVHGVFEDRDMSSGTGAMTADCTDFITWPAAAAPPAGAGCIFVPRRLETEAETFRTDPGQPRISGQHRADWLNQTLRTLAHELAHERVHQTPPTAAPGVGAGCAGATTLFHCASSGEDFDVDFYLDELNATLSEFPAVFAFVRRRSPRGNYSALLHNLQRDYWDSVFNHSESVLGVLTALRCAAGCSCADVDAHVRQITRHAIAHQPGGAWDATTRGVFQDMMNSMFPTVRYPRDAIGP